MKMDRRNFNLPTDATFGTGHRVALRPDGNFVMAEGDDAGIGINVTNAIAKRSAIVQLRRPYDRRMVQGPVAAGAGLYYGDAGVLTANPGSSDRPIEISLAPLGEVTAEIWTMPVGRGDPLPASVTNSPTSPPNPAKSKTPASAGPAFEEIVMTNPIAEVYQLRSQLVAAGVAPSAAMGRVLSENPALQMAYGRAVRRDPAALGTAAKVEAERLVAAKVAAGMSRTDAVCEVFRKDPDLQARVIAAGRPAATTAHTQPTASRPSKPQCVAEVERRVAALKARGVDHPEAVVRVFKADPALHRQYLAAHNPGRNF
jgi:hypothetical protein